MVNNVVISHILKPPGHLHSTEFLSHHQVRGLVFKVQNSTLRWKLIMLKTARMCPIWYPGQWMHIVQVTSKMFRGRNRVDKIQKEELFQETYHLVSRQDLKCDLSLNANPSASYAGDTRPFIPSTVLFHLLFHSYLHIYPV